MKKILTFFVALGFALTSMASTTFTFQDGASVNQSKDGVTVSVVKGSGQNAPAYNDNYNELRLYAKNTITVSGNGLTRISLSFTMPGNKKAYATLSANTGSLVSGGSASEPGEIKVDVWTGDATSVTFTLGDSGQRVLKQIIVNGDGSDDNPTVPDNPDVPSFLDPDWTYDEPTVVGVNSKAVQGDEYSFVDNNIQVSCTKGAVTSDYFSAHAGFDMTFTATQDIKGIEINGMVKKDFSATASAGNITYLSPVNDTDADPVIVITDINSRSVTISCVKQLRCYEVKVYFKSNPETTIGGNGNGNPGSGEVVTVEYDSAEIIYESYYSELFETPNFTVMLYDEANYYYPYVCLDIYPESENIITGYYNFADYTLSEYSYYVYGPGDDDYTFALNGNATIKKNGSIYKITGSITCDNGTTYEFSFTGTPDFYSDNQYYYDEEDGWVWNDQAPDSEDFETGVEAVEFERADSDVMYDLMGRPVGEGYRGIYIKNGRKYIGK